MKRCREEDHAGVDNDDTKIDSGSDPISDDNSSSLVAEPTAKKQIVINSGTSSYYSLGCNYRDGVGGVEQDYIKAFELFSKGAEEGCSESIFNIGLFYYKGLGVEVDYAKALNWYLKAAENGNSDAQYNIGYLYQHGEGVEQDDVKALGWHLKAAENGNSDAQYNTGYLYQHGVGVEHDNVKALKWYMKAAENGNSDAQYNIGYLYQNGKGVEQDDVKAFEWYMKAAENGDSDAQYNIGYLYEYGEGVEQDDVKAFEWYMKAAENGDSDAQNSIGHFFLEGKGVEIDWKKSLFWETKALNDTDFKFIEPFYEFGIEAFKNSDDSATDEILPTEKVIIRFEEKDFTVSNNFKSSKYLSTMMNSNWRDFNQKQESQMILDLRSIQGEIFQDNTNSIHIFEIYLNYLERDILPNDLNLKLKLIELSRYLGDDQCILKIMEESNLLIRLFILFKFEMIEPIHIATASYYVAKSDSSSLNVDGLSENALEVLLNHSQLSSIAKIELYHAFVKKFNKPPASITFSKLINTQIQKICFR